MKLLILRETDGHGGHYDTVFDGSNVDIQEVERFVSHLEHQLMEDEFEEEPFERYEIPNMVQEKFDLKELYDVIDVVEYGY